MRTLSPILDNEKLKNNPENKGLSRLIPMNLAIQNRENLPDYKQYISLGFTPKPEKKYRFHTKPLHPMDASLPLEARIPKSPGFRAIFLPVFPSDSSCQTVTVLVTM